MILIKSSASGEVLRVAIRCEEVRDGESEASQNIEPGVQSSLLGKRIKSEKFCHNPCSVCVRSWQGTYLCLRTTQASSSDDSLRINPQFPTFFRNNSEEFRSLIGGSFSPKYYLVRKFFYDIAFPYHSGASEYADISL